MKIFWRVTFNKTAVVLLKDGTNLENELVSVLGTTTCMAGQTICNISIEIKHDNVSNYCSLTYIAIILNCNLSREKLLRFRGTDMQSEGGNLTSAQFLCKPLFMYRLSHCDW